MATPSECPFSIGTVIRVVRRHWFKAVPLALVVVVVVIYALLFMGPTIRDACFGCGLQDVLHSATPMAVPHSVEPHPSRDPPSFSP